MNTQVRICRIHVMPEDPSLKVYASDALTQEIVSLTDEMRKEFSEYPRGTHLVRLEVSYTAELLQSQEKSLVEESESSIATQEEVPEFAIF